MSNIEKLEGTKALLLQICKVQEDSESFDSFTKEDFTNLNKKMFISIIYIFVKSINEKYIKSLPWPVLDKKQSDVFITMLLKLVDVINKDYPWAHIPHCTRSHFVYPRPESDKVVDFLWSVASTTIHILADIRPGQMTADEIKMFSDELKATRRQNELELEKLLAQEAEIDKNMKSASNVLNEKHQELIDLGLLAPADEFTLPKLHEVQDKLEAELVELLQELNTLSGNISDYH